MLLSFFDVFRFFSETELTDEQRKYELICVLVVCILSLASVVISICKNAHKGGERKNDFK